MIRPLEDRTPIGNRLTKWSMNAATRNDEGVGVVRPQLPNRRPGIFVPERLAHSCRRDVRCSETHRAFHRRKSCEPMSEIRCRWGRAGCPCVHLIDGPLRDDMRPRLKGERVGLLFKLRASKGSLNVVVVFIMTLNQV